MTLVLRYLRVESPCGGASDGIVKPGSGCAEAAREPWAGVPVLAGAGLGASVAGAGDYQDELSARRPSCWGKSQ